MVGLLRRRVAVLLLLRGLERECGAGRLPDLVHVLARGRELDLEHLLAVLTLDLLRTAKVLRGAVVTLRAPSDIVQVAHGVHHEDVDVCSQVSKRTVRTSHAGLTTRKPEHVLEEGGEHVPRLEVHQGADEVETVSGGKRDDNVAEGGVRPDQA